MTEDEMAGWHHRLDGHEFGWIPGVCDGQGDLVCCDSCGHKESDTTEGRTELNWTELKICLKHISSLDFISVANQSSCHNVGDSYELLEYVVEKMFLC